MSALDDIVAAKHAARAAARVRRDTARAGDTDRAGEVAANARLLELLSAHRGTPMSGYVAIRSELSPLAAMTDWVRNAPVCLPVVTGRARPLAFRRWSPGCAMETGVYGTQIPADRTSSNPAVLIVPLLAFDRAGGRLGYGGGYYDRTLAALRDAGQILAIGFAYAAQESPDLLPRDKTDATLDAIVTETATLVPSGPDKALAPVPLRP